MLFSREAITFRENCRVAPCIPATLAVCACGSAFTAVKGVSLLLVAVTIIDKVIAAGIILSAVYIFSTSLYIIKFNMIDRQFDGAIIYDSRLYQIFMTLLLVIVAPIAYNVI